MHTSRCDEDEKRFLKVTVERQGDEHSAVAFENFGAGRILIEVSGRMLSTFVNIRGGRDMASAGRGTACFWGVTFWRDRWQGNAWVGGRRVRAPKEYKPALSRDMSI